MDGKVKSESQSNKQKICLKVKIVVFQLVHFIEKKMASIELLEGFWTAHLQELLLRWEK